MEDKRTFQMNSNMTLDELVRILEQFLSVQKHLTTQKFNTGGKFIIQCADADSGWKQFLGLDAALTIELFETSSGTLSVSIGNAKWLDKLGAAAAGAFIFTPLMLTAGVGAVRQAVLPTEIFEFIKSRVEGTENPFASFTAPFANVFSQEKSAPAQEESAVCPCCGSPVNPSHAFCSKCGTKL